MIVRIERGRRRTEEAHHGEWQKHQLKKLSKNIGMNQQISWTAPERLRNKKKQNKIKGENR